MYSHIQRVCVNRRGKMLRSSRGVDRFQFVLNHNVPTSMNMFLFLKQIQILESVTKISVTQRKCKRCRITYDAELIGLFTKMSVSHWLLAIAYYNKKQLPKKILNRAKRPQSWTFIREAIKREDCLATANIQAELSIIFAAKHIAFAFAIVQPCSEAIWKGCCSEIRKKKGIAVTTLVWSSSYTSCRQLSGSDYGLVAIQVDSDLSNG